MKATLTFLILFLTSITSLTSVKAYEIQEYPDEVTIVTIQEAPAPAAPVAPVTPAPAAEVRVLKIFPANGLTVTVPGYNGGAPITEVLVIEDPVFPVKVIAVPTDPAKSALFKTLGLARDKQAGNELEVTDFQGGAPEGADGTVEPASTTAGSSGGSGCSLGGGTAPLALVAALMALCLLRLRKPLTE